MFNYWTQMSILFIYWTQVTILLFVFFNFPSTPRPNLEWFLYISQSSCFPKWIRILRIFPEKNLFMFDQSMIFQNLTLLIKKPIFPQNIICPILPPYQFGFGCLPKVPFGWYMGLQMDIFFSLFLLLLLLHTSNILVTHMWHSLNLSWKYIPRTAQTWTPDYIIWSNHANLYTTKDYHNILLILSNSRKKYSWHDLWLIMWLMTCEAVDAEYSNIQIYSNIVIQIYAFFKYIWSFSVSRIYLNIHSYNFLPPNIIILITVPIWTLHLLNLL